MDSKTKAKIQGILIGSGLVAFLIFFDKTYGPNAIAELAGSYEVFVWLFFWLVAAGRYCGQGETTSWRRPIERVLNCWNFFRKINKSV